MASQLTISIVTYNSGKLIGSCLEALKRQSLQDFLLIVVDNNSSDNTLELVKSIMPQAQVIQNQLNVGFGSAHNQAIAQARTEWILLLNTDLELEKDCLEKMMTATQNDDTGSIGPRLYKDKNRSAVDSLGLEKTAYFKATEIGRNQPLNESWKHSRSVWGISGACVLLRKKALESIAYPRPDRAYPEYFDELFFIYKEDVDLAGRLQQAGWQAWYQADAIGYHDRRGTAPASLSQTREHRLKLPEYIKHQSYKNHWFFIIKQAPLLAWLLILPYEAMKFGYLLMFETKTLGGLQEVAQKLPRLLNRRKQVYATND